MNTQPIRDAHTQVFDSSLTTSERYDAAMAFLRNHFPSLLDHIDKLERVRDQAEDLTQAVTALGGIIDGVAPKWDRLHVALNECLSALAAIGDES